MTHLYSFAVNTIVSNSKNIYFNFNSLLQSRKINLDIVKQTSIYLFVKKHCWKTVLEMAVQPIYNPVVPCVHPIPGGMYPGRMIRFQGTIPPGAQRFAINLQCGPNTDPRDDIALHLNFRFVEMCIVRNHLTAMNWGMEETSGGMPLVRGESFEALVLCEPQSLKVAINGVHFCEFPHRLPYQRISHLTIDGDVMINFIGFEGAQPPPTQMYMSEPPAYGAYGAPPPSYGAPGYGAPQGFY